MFNLLKRALVSLLFVYFATYASAKNITVIVPLEHEAMIQIVSGIKESLKDENVNIEVRSAHSDPNLMLAIIKQIKDQSIDIIMPIGTTATQMTASHIKNIPIIGVATMLQNSQNPFLSCINDEIPITASISRLPKLNNIAVIYSASEKVIPEIDELKAYAAKNNVKVHFAMIQTLTDLPLAAKSAPKDVQAFLILKDHLVVSGANIIALEAAKRSIPLIASDEGSVIKGAHVAIGIKEKDIGIEAGKLAKQILSSPDKVENKNMNDFVIFINQKAFANQNILTEDDIKALNMPILKVE